MPHHYLILYCFRYNTPFFAEMREKKFTRIVRALKAEILQPGTLINILSTDVYQAAQQLRVSPANWVDLVRYVLTTLPPRYCRAMGK